MTQARAELRRLLCPCGCGQYADEAHNPASRYEVDADTVCQAGRALHEYRDAHDPDPGVLLVARRVTAESVEDDAAFIARAKAMRSKIKKS